MKFLIDAQLPPKLTQWLNEQGFAAEHVFDVLLSDSDDIAIWNQALTTGAIIITKDEDFAERAARTLARPVIVWLRVGNATNKALIKWLIPRWPAILQLLSDGHRLVEVR